jgi:tetratricopeptide (TPR) repeat protein
MNAPRHGLRPALGLVMLALLAAPSRADVAVEERRVTIPTYLAGPPERNPMFFFGQGSQGAEGRVYPYPLYDTLTHQKVDKTYTLVTLENEYIRVGILPEIGGRVFEGVDKTNGYDFFYRQHVIKPALIGLTGAWISGGVEWNIPHHHRASTFVPVQHRVEAHADGGKTVWVGELEPRHRMRWAVGYTLRPGRSTLEARVRVVNRTAMPQTMLSFANAAVHATPDYQVIFPPRTRFVTHHAKRQFNTWPIARGGYGGSDFGAGTDVSYFRNHQGANSMFAWNDADDFFAGYDHGKGAGTMSVADHHVVPGKKLWTWGNGPRGRMWDKILTDNDGPYIELMVGAYSDNQPDYSWLQPYETRSFTQVWYPFRAIGGVTLATADAAVNLDVKGTKARLGFAATRSYPRATARLLHAGRPLFEKAIALDPATPFVAEVDLPAGADPRDLRAVLVADEAEILSYTPPPPDAGPMPEPVRDPLPPAEIKTVEELYLAGLRIEQFHDPARDPEAYWDEALRRDPLDARVNTAYAVRLLKRARFADAEAHLRRAIGRLTASYTSPMDVEPFYHLGVALQAQGRLDAAYDAYYKATWGGAWRGPAYYGLAEIAARRGDLAAARYHVERALVANGWNLRAWTLKAALLRHAGDTAGALAALDAAARDVDPLDVRVLAERWLATRAPDDARRLAAALGEHPATAMETAVEYRNAGLAADGLAVLRRLDDRPDLPAMALYAMGDLAEADGESDLATAYRRRAAAAPADPVFPFQAEGIAVLRGAMRANPEDARAPYHLGNLLFDWQPDEAVRLWERAAALDPAFPIAHRNLALAYSRRPGRVDLERAATHLERAVAAPEPYPIHLAERDELLEALGTSPATRLGALEAQAEIVARRDDALARQIGLLIAVGRYDDAIRLLSGRRFAVWEGGTLGVADDWARAHLLRGRQHLDAGRAREALADFQAAANVPENLPTESLGPGRHAAAIALEIGRAREALGDREGAVASWEAAARGPADPGRHGEPDPEAAYRALALQKLGRAEAADGALRDLAAAADRAIAATSDPVDTAATARDQAARRERAARARYVAALAYLGQGRTDRAREALAAALTARPDHAEARARLAELDAVAKPANAPARP